MHDIKIQQRSNSTFCCLTITDIAMFSIKFIKGCLCCSSILDIAVMASICIVKFDSHGANEVCFVPETCLQSSKNVRIKINGDYLFVHKNDRQHRARGKLLFTGRIQTSVNLYVQGVSRFFSRIVE